MKKAGRKAPTIKHVAHIADVSTATVSRVLSGAGGVSEKLTEKVQLAAGKLNYHPNRNARNLRTHMKQTVGVIIPDIENPFYTSVIHGIEETLQLVGYNWFLYNADEDIEKERKRLATFIEEDVIGIITAPTHMEKLNDIYQNLIERGTALVFFDRRPQNIEADYVSVNNKEGARTAVLHLISQGYKEIGLICGPTYISVYAERQEGYMEALSTRNIPAKAELIQTSLTRQQSGFTAMQNLLELSSPPQAVFIANNLMTLGALQAIHQRNLRIPFDIALVGFDDMPWAASLQPPLTVVSQPAFEIGKTAAKYLIERIKDPSIPYRIATLETKLIIRASCGGYKYLISQDNGKY